MSDAQLVRLGRSVAAVGILSSVASFGFCLAAGQLSYWWRSFAGMTAVVGVAFGVVVWLVIPTQPRNRAVWAMSASSLFAVNGMGIAWIALVAPSDPYLALNPDWAPAQSATWVAWMFVVTAALSILGLFVPLTFGLMLFPDGSLRSSRWRPVALVAGVSTAVLAVAHGWWHHPSNASGNDSGILLASLSISTVAVIVSVVGVFVGYRASTGTARLQFKWVVCGTACGAGVFTMVAFLPDSAVDNVSTIVLVTFGAIGWVTAYGIAVAKYRLYEIDVVISRAFVVVALGVLITGIYVAIVVGLGGAFGRSNVWLSVAATALVAAVFEPARTVAQRWASRLVYGKRATPYEVLSWLTRQLTFSESGDALLVRLVEGLRDGTGARRAVVWRVDDEWLRPIAVAPRDAAPPGQAARADRLPGTVFPVGTDGELLGHLSIEEAPGASFNASDVQLAEDLASSATLVLRKLSLADALARTAADLERSRERLVRAQDDELRRMELELNAGVEQQIIALKLRLTRARSTARCERSDRVADLLGRLTAEAQDAIDQIGALAQGIRPSRLDAEGLDAAIPDLAGRAPLEVRVDTRVGRRLPPAVEGAIYFCVSEALTNASKYARGPVMVSVKAGDRAVEVEVSDAGPGFAVGDVPSGSGLRNMGDRLEALGGELTIRSEPGGSTTVTGSIPMFSRALSTAG